MTAVAMRWALSAWDISPECKFVLVMIADRATEDGKATPRNSRLCVDTNLPSERVADYIDEMVDKGYLEPIDGDCYRLAMPSAESGPRYDGWKKPVPRLIAQAVFARDGYHCLRCGETEGLTVDHVAPQSRGGSDDMENLQSLCRSCNAIKGTTETDYRPGRA